MRSCFSRSATKTADAALVIGRADEERVVELADSIKDMHLRAGDSLLLEPKSGHVIEKLPKPEVEELILEEVPDISYDDIGGLTSQIEEIMRCGRAALPARRAVPRARAGSP